MKLMLETDLPIQPNYLNHQSSILSVGSCFSIEIGHRLIQSGFDVEVNPYGIIFNPHSIHNALTMAFKGEVNESQFIQKEEQYFSFDFHSQINATAKKELLNQIETLNTGIVERLKSCTHLFITFGTAWVYQNSNKRIVANCHKVPAREFDKVLLDREAEIGRWSTLLSDLMAINPSLKVLMTVSPVRHSKDGLRENNLSKGILHQIIFDLEQKFECVDYFPSYEILIDELRDYRYFSGDLVHPSDIAVDYIYDKFKSSFFSQKTIEISELHFKLAKAKEHRFINASERQIKEHQDFIIRLEQQIKNIHS